MEDVDFTGRTVDHYNIVALIRGGAQGRVYRGHDEVLHREVAIKVLNTSGPFGGEAHHDLITEARVLSSLNHPNVAGVYDFVTQDQRDFMVMEFIAGATLQEVLAGGPLPFIEVARLGAQLARGLAAAHAAAIAHRDIKPANLKITSSGLLKIVDFGLATPLPIEAMLADADTTPGVVAGTLPYMAPEVLHGQPPDERSDIFSAGAVLYEMATGCRAFPQTTLPGLVHAIDTADAVAPSRINPAVPHALDRVIARALMKAPSARYPKAMVLASALEGLLDHRPPVPPRLRPRVPRRIRRAGGAG
jgi:serine/threonine protein kinase